MCKCEEQHTKVDESAVPSLAISITGTRKEVTEMIRSIMNLHRDILYIDEVGSDGKELYYAELRK